MTKTICKNCGEEIEAYFRGRQTVWKHKNKLRHCSTQPMYQTKAEPLTTDSKES